MPGDNASGTGRSALRHGAAGGEDLDDVDRLLITQLQADGRLSYSELGALAGLSAGGARLRVLRLQERGVLDVVGVTDPLKLGYRSMAMLGVRVTGDVKTVADAIGSLEEVIYLVLVAGSIDLLVEVIAPDTEALFEIINEKIRRIPGVGQLETFTYYKTHTHRFTWGAR